MAGVNSWEWEPIARVSLIGRWFISGAMIEGLSGDDLAACDGAWNRILLAQCFYEDGLFLSSTRYLARQVAKSGTPTYLYYMDYVQKNLRADVPGAAHGNENEFVWGMLREHPELQRPRAVPLTPEDMAFGDLIRGYWLNFARTGNPNGGDRPVWPRYESTSDQWMVFGSPTHSESGVKAAELNKFETQALERRRRFYAERRCNADY